MTEWISFIVAFGIVVPWLTLGACLFAEWTCETLSHRWRMRTDAIYRDVEIQFRADLAEAGLDSRTVPIQFILRWSSVVATACFLSHDIGWLLSMRWLWSMSAPMIALEIAAILIAAGCLNLTAASFAQRLRARRQPAVGRGTGDDCDCDDLLRAAEALSTQYDAIADGNRRHAGE